MTVAYDMVRELLDYSPESGVFHWKATGKIAGYVDAEQNGYKRRRIKISGTLYRSSTLAWLYMTSEWPTLEVDHINRCGDDDRWENLRLATQSQQCINRKTWGKYPRGVSKYSSGYMARITRDGVTKYLGTFETLEDAAEAYTAAAREYGYDS